MNRPRIAKAAVIALVLAASVFFRFDHLERKLLWHDELATRVFAAGYTVDEWKQALFTGKIVDVEEVRKYQHHNPDKSVMDAIRGLAVDDPQHPPLYYVLTRIWVGLFGDSLATLRALSAIASLLSLPLAFWLCRELFASARIAWIAVALFGLSPFFVLYAQEAREYALWTTLILLSNASLLRAVRLTENHPGVTRRHVAAWALYSAATVLSLYTSFTTASVILSQLAWLAFRERLRPTRVAAMAFVTEAVSALLFLPWAYELMQHFEAFQISMKWSKVIVIPREALLRILGQNISRTVLDTGHDIAGTLDWVMMLAAVALVAFAIVTVVRRSRRESSALVVLLILLPIGMLLLPDLLSGGIRSVSMRYLTPAWVGVLVALAFLLGNAEKFWAWAAPTAAVLAAAFASDVANVPRVAVWTKATSVSLPRVAEEINAAPSPLLVGNLERHNPGNLMALAVLLKPGTKMQFLDTKMEEHYVLPREYGTVFLFSPITEYREAMEQRENAHSELLLRDTFLDLWKVETR